MPVDAAVYVRISKDRFGDGLGVARQEPECRELAEARGWVVAEVFEDDDRSAFTGRERPAYARMMEGVVAGRFGAIVAWHPDRLHREQKELEAFIDAVNSAGTLIATVQAGVIDLATPAGRMTARVVGAVAQQESEHKSERLKLKHKELAAAGRYSGGPRPYGYEGDGVTVRESEAAVIREVARRLLAHESVRSVNLWLNEAGHLSATGKPWRRQALVRMLRSPRLAGRRVHRGRDVGEAVWPPILDRVTHQRLVRHLEANSAPKGRQPRYLLSGLAYCGVCGSKMLSRPRSGKRTLACVKEANGVVLGCGKVTQLAEPLDDLVVRLVLLELDTPGTARRMAARPEVDEVALQCELDGIGLQLESLADQFVAGTLDEVSWAAARGGLTRRADAVRAELVKAVPMPVSPWVGRGGELAAIWERMEIDEQRGLIGDMVEQVVVAPAPARGSRAFHPERVTIVWR